MYEPDVLAKKETEIIHTVSARRRDEIMRDAGHPKVEEVRQDDVPRAILIVQIEGEVVRQEYIESSKAVADLDKEYLEALGHVRIIAIHYPSMFFNDQFVVAKIASLKMEAIEQGIDMSVSIEGYSYGHTGEEVRIE